MAKEKNGAAQRLDKAELAKLQDKVKRGRPLSATERERVAGHFQTKAATPERRIVPSIAELAAALGVSRRSVTRWRLLPGNPGPTGDGDWNVDDWRLFTSTLKEDRAAAEEELSNPELRARQLLLQNEKLEFQLRVMRAEYVPAADVEKWGAQLGQSIRKIVTQLHLIAPQLAGLQIAEIEDALKRSEAETLAQLHVLDEAAAAYRPPE